MVKVYALIPRRNDVTIEKFHAHWRNVHAPLGKRITTIRRYVQSHVLRPAVSGLPTSIYEGVAEVWFDDLETATSMGDDPDYSQYAGADEPNFIDQSKLMFLFCNETVTLPGPSLAADGEEVKALLLLNRTKPTTWLTEEVAPRALALPRIQRLAFSVSDVATQNDNPSFDTVVELSWRDLPTFDVAWSAPEADLLRDSLVSGIDVAHSAGMITDQTRVIWP